MSFCREFHMTPLEFLEQPADVIFAWNRYCSIESEEVERKQKMEEIKSRRVH